MQLTQEYRKARPIVKGIVALIMRLRYPVWTRDDCFEEAEKWLEEVEKS